MAAKKRERGGSSGKSRSGKRDGRAAPEAAAEAGAAEGGRSGAMWSGVITFGLVSVPVELFTGLRASTRGLQMVTDDGTALRRQYYCPKEAKALERDELVRGAEVEPGVFVTLSDEELEALAPRQSREIDLSRFVRRDEIPPLLFDRPYLLAPAGVSNKAYRLLTAAMEREDRVGIATFVMRGKQYLVAIIAERGILRAETLRFQTELRDASELALPAGAADRKRAQRLAREIARRRRPRLPVDELHDEDQAALQQLVQRKLKKGLDVVSPPELEDEGDDEGDEGAEVVDIMALLRQRVGGAQPTVRGPRRQARPQQSQAELQARSREALYREAQELGVPGRSSMTKRELIAAIRRKARGTARKSA